jgi:hypothetical protein
MNDPAALIRWHSQQAVVGARLEAISRYSGSGHGAPAAGFPGDETTDGVTPSPSVACEGAGAA